MHLDQKIIQAGIGLLAPAKTLGNSHQLVKQWGRVKIATTALNHPRREVVEKPLYEVSGRKPILANRVDPSIEKTITSMAINVTAYGQLNVSNALRRQGIRISPGGVRSIWLRGRVNTTKKRPKALETKMA